MLEYFLPRASEYAKDIDHLFDVITYLVGFWFLLTLGFFFYVLFRFRRKAGQKAQYLTGETHREKLAVEIPHYLILVCDLVILVWTFMVWHKVKIDLPPADEEIRVVAQQWAWSFYHAGADGVLGTDDDIAKVNELYLKNNTQYTFYLESPDVMHSFSIPVFRLKQDAVPGRIITGHFKTILEGEWDIQCAEMCGFGHGFMPARMFVKNEADYAEWIAENAPETSGGASSIAAVETTDSKTKEAKSNG
ncbi:cytochrome c oxidase subunit II [Pelagicoccus sp. SDUM812003]|uniref:cytochrome c oxidase subunit II n=1 Tax=Pelagicoccus sp. SDUM812003 TaxID=3041267 RepID=UPI00280FEA9B|nr:cytochrome c oxidase subunit II [Pelagicoccus sp. SDUM812003]MDQ8204945.1 cytochrome c oxidase subunit II [Pelagicoccus sp. SDUM812003]